MIEVFKILKGFYVLSSSTFFTLSSSDYKLLIVLLMVEALSICAPCILLRLSTKLFIALFFSNS